MLLRKLSPPEPAERQQQRPVPPVHGARPNFDAALADLHSPLAACRCASAAILAHWPPACAAMGRQLEVETDARVQQALFTSLSRQANDLAAAALLPLLRSNNAPLRNGAIEALASMPKATGARMDALLNDSDPDVRIFAVNLLADLCHDRVTPWLVQVLETETEVNVVAAAIEVLAETGTPDQVPVLERVKLLFAADPFIGFAADMAIERVRAA